MLSQKDLNDFYGSPDNL